MDVFECYNELDFISNFKDLHNHVINCFNDYNQVIDDWYFSQFIRYTNGFFELYYVCEDDEERSFIVEGIITDNNTWISNINSD